MPSSLHTKRFYEAVLTKKNLLAKPRSFRADYLRHFWIRRVCETLFVTALISGSQQHLLMDGIFGPISPVTGIALSALFLRGRSMLVGIFLGNLISYLFSYVPMGAAMLYSSIFTLYILLIRETCLRLMGPVTPLDKVETLIQFTVICSFFSALHVILMSTVLIIPISFYQTWLGELNGILYLTPLCLMFEPFSTERFFTKQAWRWWICSLVILVLQCAMLVAPESYIFPTSMTMFAIICVYAFIFEPIPLGFTLLGLSVLYLGTSFSQHAYESKAIITILLLQAIISLSITICRFQRIGKKIILPD